MAHNSDYSHIWAEIENPLTIDEIATCLGTDEDHLEELCVHDNINPMSKHKPTNIAAPSIDIDNPAEVSVQIKADNGDYASGLSAYGVRKPLFQLQWGRYTSQCVGGIWNPMADGYVGFCGVSGFDALDYLFLDKWSYEKPQSWKRQLDFHHYLTKSRQYGLTNSRKPYAVPSAWGRQDIPTAVSVSSQISRYVFENYHLEGEGDAGLLGLKALFGADRVANDPIYFGTLCYAPSSASSMPEKNMARTTQQSVMLLHIHDTLLGQTDSTTGLVDSINDGMQNVPKFGTDRATGFVAGDHCYVTPVIIRLPKAITDMTSGDYINIYSLSYIDEAVKYHFVPSGVVPSKYQVYINSVSGYLNCRYLSSGEYAGCYLVYFSSDNDLNMSIYCNSTSGGKLPFGTPLQLYPYGSDVTARHLATMDLGTGFDTEAGMRALSVGYGTNSYSLASHSGRSQTEIITGATIHKPFVIIKPYSASATSARVSVSFQAYHNWAALKMWQTIATLNLSKTAETRTAISLT